MILSRSSLLASAFAAVTLGSITSAQTPIASALESVSEEVQIYDAHVTTLSNPFMEGRVPGSRGMEMAKEYMDGALLGA